MKVKKTIFLILTILSVACITNYSLCHATPNINNITEEEYIRTIRLLLYPYFLNPYTLSFSLSI